MEDKELQTGLNFLQKESTMKETELTFGCNECGSEFTHLRELEVHAKRLHVHINKSAMKKEYWMFKCNACITNFQHFSGLKNHVKGVHLNINPFECQECKETFTTKGMLRKHVQDNARSKTHHLDVKIHKCDQCNTYFSRNGEMKEHKKMKHSNKPFFSM